MLKKTIFYVIFAAVALGILEFLGNSSWFSNISFKEKKVDGNELRIGYFPNITHAQALIAKQMELEGKSWFAPRMPAETKIFWQPYSAGMSAMEGLAIDSIDISYVGPSPAINAFIRRNGEVRIVSGSAEGGAALVVSKDFAGTTAADFSNEKIATPQLGNTQDVACRAWLAENNVTGTIIAPTKNPDQLALFKAGILNAAWTAEPWVSRLELEAGGRIFKEDFHSTTTILAASKQTILRKKALLEAFQKAHSELTNWINSNPDEAKIYLQRALSHETKSDFPQKIVNNAFPRIRFVAEIDKKSLQEYISAGFATGTIPEKIDVEKLLDSKNIDGNGGAGVNPQTSENGKFLQNGILDLSLPKALLVTLRRLVFGYAIGFIIAIPLGLLLSQSKFFRDTLGIVALGFQALPSVCWVPISLVIFGQDECAILTVVVLGSVWSLMLATEN